jgi:hypothetical protein
VSESYFPKHSSGELPKVTPPEALEAPKRCISCNAFRHEATPQCVFYLHHIFAIPERR